MVQIEDSKSMLAIERASMYRDRATSVVRRVGTSNRKNLIVAVAVMIVALLTSAGSTVGVILSRPTHVDDSGGGATLRDRRGTSISTGQAV